MKKVLSISVGSSIRDHTTECEFLGQRFQLSRIGTDGDFERAIELYRDYDGKVDAFGVGGTLFYLHVGKRNYYWRDRNLQRIREAVKISKIGDGNAVKPLLARRAFVMLESFLQERGSSLAGRKALMTCAVDRYGMAEALVQSGCETVFGDFMFNLGMNVPLHSLFAVRFVAAILLPVITRLPYEWFYPLGEKQEREPKTRFRRYYEQADVIAGDYLLIRDYMPPDLGGKIIVTNTTTVQDLEEMRRHNLQILVTTTPRLAGRSFGTNVIEAALRTLIDKPDSEVTETDFLELVEKIPINPAIEVLKQTR